MRELFAADRQPLQDLLGQGGRPAARLLEEPRRREGHGTLVRAWRAMPASRSGASAMWKGEHINVTEDRAVGHMALRYMGDKKVVIDGKDVMPDVRAVLGAMKVFSDSVRDGSIKGATGETFTDVVNIGIGGSDLGPAMVTLALAPITRDGPPPHYVSNVDGAHIHDTLKGSTPSARCSSSPPRPSPPTRP
jgi:glucose-6-phosphate isomerase